MVDGVLASCYALTDHYLSHFTMTPIQLFPKITEWVLGDDSGFLTFANIAEQLGRSITPFGQLWKI